MSNDDINKKYLNPVMILNFIKGLIAVPAGFITANLISDLTDKALKGMTIEVIRQAIFLSVFVVIYRLLCLLLDIMSGRHSAKDVQSFKTSIYKSFLMQPPWVASKFTSGRTIESFTDDVGQTVAFYTKTLPDFINGIIMLVSYTVYIMTKNISFAIVLLGMGSIQIIPPIIVKKYMVQNYDDTRKIEAEVTEHTVTAYKGFETIKLYNLKNWYFKVLSEIHKRYLKIGIRSETTMQSQNMMESAESYILKFGTYGIIGWFVFAHIISINTGVQAIALYTGLYGAIKTIFDGIPAFYVSGKADERIKELTGAAPADYDYSKDLAKSGRNKPVYEVKDLSYSYGDKTVLKNAGFKIMTGDITVVKGANGEGKSTLLDILLGLKHDYSGSVLFFGTELRRLDPEIYKGYVSAVFQNENGFDMKAAEFFGLFEDAGIIDKDKAFKLAREFGLSQDELDKEIKNLSGGEFKKLYIIVGLLKNSEVIFLDEPGNSLDEEAKELLKQKLISCGKTVFLITHDPYFMDIAACIMEIKNGEVFVERRDEHEKASAD